MPAERVAMRQARSIDEPLGWQDHADQNKASPRIGSLKVSRSGKNLHPGYSAPQQSPFQLRRGICELRQASRQGKSANLNKEPVCPSGGDQPRIRRHGKAAPMRDLGGERLGRDLRCGLGECIRREGEESRQPDPTR